MSKIVPNNTLNIKRSIKRIKKSVYALADQYHNDHNPYILKLLEAITDSLQASLDNDHVKAKACIEKAKVIKAILTCDPEIIKSLKQQIHQTNNQ